MLSWFLPLLFENNDPKIVNVCDEICSSITLAQGKKNIIIDTGNLGYEEEIIHELKSFSLTPEDIDYVINTHGHLDHVSNNYLFTNATRIASNSTWFPDKRIKSYNDITKLKIAEIKIIKTPGHTPDHLSIIIKADKTYVVAGDAIREDIIKKFQKSEVSGVLGTGRNKVDLRTKVGNITIRKAKPPLPEEKPIIRLR